MGKKLPERLRAAIDNGNKLYWHRVSDQMFELRAVTRRQPGGKFRSVNIKDHYYYFSSSRDKAQALEDEIIEAGGNLEPGSLDRFYLACERGPKWITRRRRS